MPLGRAGGRLRLSSHLDGREDHVDGELRLRPAEGVVVEVRSTSAYAASGRAGA